MGWLSDTMAGPSIATYIAMEVTQTSRFSIRSISMHTRVLSTSLTLWFRRYLLGEPDTDARLALSGGRLTGERSICERINLNWKNHGTAHFPPCITSNLRP